MELGRLHHVCASENGLLNPEQLGNIQGTSGKLLHHFLMNAVPGSLCSRNHTERSAGRMREPLKALSEQRALKWSAKRVWARSGSSHFWLSSQLLWASGCYFSFFVEARSPMRCRVSLTDLPRSPCWLQLAVRTKAWWIFRWSLI